MKQFRALAALSAAAFFCGAAHAPAQPQAPEALVVLKAPVRAPLADANWHAIRVRNQRPSMIAYQLDPEHNGVPAFFNVPGDSLRANPSKNAAIATKVATNPFDLPAAVTQLVPADERNLLFVAGGDATQIRRVQELVAILDQPIRRVEIEAHLVQLNAAEMAQFGFDFATPRANFDATTKAATMPAPGAMQVGFVRDDFQKRLDNISAADKTRVLAFAPIAVANNYSQAISLRSGPVDNTGANQGKPPVASATGADAVLTFTPTINGDDTITVLMLISPLPESPDWSGLESIVNLRDGNTIALTGLSQRLASLFGATDAERKVVVFLTARLARDDEK